MSLKHIEDAIEKVALSEAARVAARYGVIGGAIGAVRKKDKDESRIRAILRSAATGAAVGGAANIGGRAAMKAMKFDPYAFGTNVDQKKQLGKALLATGVAGASGLGAYHLAKRKEKK